MAGDMSLSSCSCCAMGARTPLHGTVISPAGRNALLRRALSPRHELAHHLDSPSWSATSSAPLQISAVGLATWGARLLDRVGLEWWPPRTLLGSTRNDCQ